MLLQGKLLANALFKGDIEYCAGNRHITDRHPNIAADNQLILGSSAFS